MIEKNKRLILIKWLKQSIILLTILLVPGTGFSQTKSCKEDSRQLQGGFDVIQAKGGLWAYFERSDALKDRSILGMQADSKLQRLVVVFQDQCLDNSTPPPSPDLYKKIASLLDTARAINNKSPSRTPPEKIVSAVQGLLKTLDNLLKN